MSREEHTNVIYHLYTWVQVTFTVIKFLLLKYFLCQVLHFATSQVISVTKSHEKAMLNHVRMKQKENDKSAAAAE